MRGKRYSCVVRAPPPRAHPSTFTNSKSERNPRSSSMMLSHETGCWAEPLVISSLKPRIKTLKLNSERLLKAEGLGVFRRVYLHYLAGTQLGFSGAMIWGTQRSMGLYFQIPLELYLQIKKKKKCFFFF